MKFQKLSLLAFHSALAASSAILSTTISPDPITAVPSSTEKAKRQAPSPPIGDVTLHITNKLPGTPTLSVYGAINAGSISARNPLSTFVKSTAIALPSGWAGNFGFNIAGAPPNYQGSIIEGDWGSQTPDLWTDVSYVNGYNFPIVCSCGGFEEPVLAGCNIELFEIGVACPNPLWNPGSPNQVCPNWAPNWGPAAEFFKPCQRSAYTYPHDDLGTRECFANTISCCIGSDCPSNPRQAQS